MQDRAHVSVGPIDLHYQDAERVIGCYLLDTPDGPALFDCGPTSCLDRLRAGVRERGLQRISGVSHRSDAWMPGVSGIREHWQQARTDYRMRGLRRYWEQRRASQASQANPWVSQLMN